MKKGKLLSIFLTIALVLLVIFALGSIIGFSLDVASMANGTRGGYCPEESTMIHNLTYKDYNYFVSVAYRYEVCDGKATENSSKLMNLAEYYNYKKKYVGLTAIGELEQAKIYEAKLEELRKGMGEFESSADEFDEILKPLFEN